MSQLGLHQASLRGRLGRFGRQRVMKRRQKSPSRRCRRLCSPSPGASRFGQPRPRSPRALTHTCQAGTGRWERAELRSTFQPPRTGSGSSSRGHGERLEGLRVGWRPPSSCPMVWGAVLPEGELAGGCWGAAPTQCCAHCVCSFPSPPNHPIAFTAVREPCSGHGVPILCHCPVPPCPCAAGSPPARNPSSIPLTSSLEG